MTKIRTIAEIKKRIEEVQEFDLFGVAIDLVVYLPFEEAKEYLKPEITTENWKQQSFTRDFF